MRYFGQNTEMEAFFLTCPSFNTVFVIFDIWGWNVKCGRLVFGGECLIILLSLDDNGSQHNLNLISLFKKFTILKKVSIQLN